MSEKYEHPWLEVETVQDPLPHDVCDKCWQEKSLTGNCWCSDFGAGLNTLKGDDK